MLSYRFSGQNYDLSTLMHVSKDQLAETLSETQCSSGQIWNIEEIFRRIICWRQENVSNTLLYIIREISTMFLSTGL